MLLRVTIPQLKNLAVKKSLNNTSAYGMPNKGHVGKAGMEVDLKSTQTINELGSTESGRLDIGKSLSISAIKFSASVRSASYS